MEDDQIPTHRVSEWQPTTNAADLAHLGKLGEELNECAAAASRCVIQGIGESHPVTGKLNRDWLEDEIADVMMMIDRVTDHFGLDRNRMTRREEMKRLFQEPWFEWLKSQS
jgi:hypothetical protein